MLCSVALVMSLCDLVDDSLPGSLSMEFSRQECWGGLPCPLPEDLSCLGIEPTSPVSPASQADSLPSGNSLPGKSQVLYLGKADSLPGKPINNILITQTNSIFQNKTKFNEKNGIVLHFCECL